MRRRYDLAFLFKPLFYIFSLVAATIFVLYLEKLKPSDLQPVNGLFEKDNKIKLSYHYPLKKSGSELTEQDLENAKIAWTYFKNNSNKYSGLINGVDLSDFFSFSDVSHYYLAIFSAYEIGIIDSIEMDSRFKKLSATLQHLPLFQNKLPARKYKTSSVIFLDFNGNSTSTGDGWSATDIARFFSVINLVNLKYPQYNFYLKKIVNRWNINEFLSEGKFVSMYCDKEKGFCRTQDTRLGYEEYNAKSMLMAGYDASEAFLYDDFIRFENLYGESVACDTREVRGRKNKNYIINDPYILDGLEYGWDVNSLELCYRIFKAQKNRYLETKQFFTASASYISDLNYCLTSCVYANNEFWKCIDSDGNDKMEYNTLSVKTVFGWSVLFDDQFAETLLQKVKNLNDPSRGWYEGIYVQKGLINKSVTAATNGIILECINYKKHGRLIKF